MPLKPRRRLKRETEEEYKAQLVEWEALKLHKVDVKLHSNFMTQKYYTKQLLLVYINAIHYSRLQDASLWLLQEDSDPLHSIKKEGLAAVLKKANWVKNLKHSAQSPYLNPIKAIWNIIKQ
jgi:hypothetical protein